MRPHHKHPPSLCAPHTTVQVEGATTAAPLIQETRERKRRARRGASVRVRALAALPSSPAGAHSEFGDLFVPTPTSHLGHLHATPVELVTVVFSRLDVTLMGFR